jgi:hypothetical protein
MLNRHTRTFTTYLKIASTHADLGNSCFMEKSLISGPEGYEEV